MPCPPAPAMRNVPAAVGVLLADASLRPHKPMSRIRTRALLAFACVLILAACDAVTSGTSGNPVGIGGISARTKGTGYTSGPALSFFRVTGATFVTSANARDSCYLASYSESSNTNTTTAAKLSAGAFITLKLGSRTDTLTKPTTGTDLTYRSPLASGIPFTPGDSMVITINGDQNGFPVSTWRGKTAEAFVVNPITIPTTGAIPVTWTPAHDLNSAMFITFRYAAGTSTTFNRQIACTFSDDGAATVPAVVTSAWLAATNRDYIGQRIRTILGTVDVPLSYFNFVSSFNWPTPVSP